MMHDECVRVYVSGPITDNPDYERKFAEVSEWLEGAGFTPVSPVTKAMLSYKTYIDRGLEILQSCDAICMIPGWMDSEGAKLEHHYAGVVGLPEILIPEITWHGIEKKLRRKEQNNGNDNN